MALGKALHIAKIATCVLKWSCVLDRLNLSFWCFSSICPVHDAIVPFRFSNSGLFNAPPCNLAIGRFKEWQKSIKTTTSGLWSFILMSFSSSRHCAASVLTIFHPSKILKSCIHRRMCCANSDYNKRPRARCFSSPKNLHRSTKAIKMPILHFK